MHTHVKIMYLLLAYHLPLEQWQKTMFCWNINLELLALHYSNRMGKISCRKMYCEREIQCNSNWNFFINFKVFSFDHLVYFIINLLSKCLCSCSLKGNFSPMHAMNNEIDSLRRSTCIRKEFPEIKMLICFKNKVAQRVHEKTEMEERCIIKAVHCTIFITVRHLYIVSDLNLFNFFVCGHFVWILRAFLCSVEKYELVLFI